MLNLRVNRSPTPDWSAWEIESPPPTAPARPGPSGQPAPAPAPSFQLTLTPAEAQLVRAGLVALLDSSTERSSEALHAVLAKVSRVGRRGPARPVIGIH